MSAGAGFGQLDFEATGALRLIVAGRVDFSSLHDTQFSPRVGAVYSLSDAHTVRASVSRAFQTPTFIEYFLRIPIAPSVDLSAIERELAAELGGVSLGLSAVPNLALGNLDIDVEKVTAFDIGYRGVVGKRSFVTLEHYEVFGGDLLRRRALVSLKMDFPN